MPIALVTGGNQGIGLATVRGLAKAGVTTWLAARRPDAGEAAVALLAAEGLTVRPITLDVTDARSIAAAVARIDALDILVNNAAMDDHSDGVSSTVSVDAMRRCYEVNVFGVHAVTNAFLPLLRRSAQGRIVNVSSQVGSLALVAGGRGMPLAAYKSSKAALNMLTIELARELKDTAIKVNSIAPGFTPTNLNAHLTPPPGVKLQTIDEGAVASVKYALIGPDGPSGGFFDANDERVPW
ncbi:MAG TPA: SDR family NAD(P)-dependent oxidoreductase [Kofleriaceae bacterium]|jgi:NAD(P)-dependent dehydrogenase (short-subunit alcohol dehydrogenase family)